MFENNPLPSLVHNDDLASSSRLSADAHPSFLGGSVAVAKDFANGAVDEALHNPVHLAEQALIGVGTTVALAAILPRVPEAASLAVSGYGAISFLSKAPELTHAALVVGGAEPSTWADMQNAHATLRGAGAGTVDFATMMLSSKGVSNLGFFAGESVASAVESKPAFSRLSNFAADGRDIPTRPINISPTSLEARDIISNLDRYDVDAIRLKKDSAVEAFGDEARTHFPGQPGLQQRAMRFMMDRSGWNYTDGYTLEGDTVHLNLARPGITDKFSDLVSYVNGDKPVSRAESFIASYPVRGYVNSPPRF